MVEVRGAQRPLLAMGLGLVIVTAGLYAASHLNPKKGAPQKECTATECTVNFPGDKRGNKTTGVGSIEILGRHVAAGEITHNRVELLVGPKTLYIPMGYKREALGLEIELLRTAPDGAIIVFRNNTGARN
jgi:hypothetical protein